MRDIGWRPKSEENINKVSKPEIFLLYKPVCSENYTCILRNRTITKLPRPSKVAYVIALFITHSSPLFVASKFTTCDAKLYIKTDNLESIFRIIAKHFWSIANRIKLHRYLVSQYILIIQSIIGFKSNALLGVAVSVSHGVAVCWRNKKIKLHVFFY